MKKIFKVVLILLFSFNSGYSQCTYTIKPGPQEGKDSRVFSLNCNATYAQQSGDCQSTNFGTSGVFSASAWTWGGDAATIRSYMEFDLSSFTDTSCNVQDARLLLFADLTSNDHCGVNSGWHACKNNSFKISRVTEPWLEHTVNYINQPNISNGTNLTDEVVIADSSSYQYHDYNIDISEMVNFWIENPDSNFGFRLSLIGEFDHYRKLRFCSSDHIDAARRPGLVMTLNCDTATFCNNIIAGNIFDDIDNTCDFSTGDLGLDDWMVKIEPGPMYATTDQYGNYSVNVDMENYTVTPILKNATLWNTNCFSSYNVNFTTTDTTVSGIDFPLQASNYCADLSVDIGVSRMRKCHNEWFKVEYCNKGNLDEDSVYVDVTFDEFIHPLSASEAFTCNADSSLRFFIDSLDAYECGFFTISTLIDCDVDFGITQCAQAEIYPLNYCEPIDSTWDKSSVQVSGQCIGDSTVCFTILNTGTAGNGDMAGTSNWHLYEDGTLIQSGNFQLNGQETLELCFPANSHTLELTADQRPGHPGNSHPNEIIEACGTDTSVEIVSATSFDEDDIDNHTEIYCDVIRSSYDPNEKVVKPMGITDDHYISSNTQMEYVIHFQNKGNDTAYLVVIKDTLPLELDPTTLISGVASHEYSYRMFDNGIVEWRFENIMLVDSATNEEESEGYVKFKINQMNNLPHGTYIENRAGIFFDFNTPIITEYAWNVIWDSTIVVESSISEMNDFKVFVYPNPAKDRININFTNKGKRKIQIQNMLGQIIISESTSKDYNGIDISEYSDGVYIYSVLDEKGAYTSGKFIKE